MKNWYGTKYQKKLLQRRNTTRYRWVSYSCNGMSGNCANKSSPISSNLTKKVSAESKHYEINIYHNLLEILASPTITIQTKNTGVIRG